MITSASAELPFRFFVPLTIEKGMSGEDLGSSSTGQKYLCRIHGVASTDHMDEDAEILDPNGFDLSYFMENGLFNYNHIHDDPDAVVGEPTAAFVRDNKLYVEGILYDKPRARKLMELHDSMIKAGSNRRIGYSIEGKATYRDPQSPNKVCKARITGCAITPTPKNTNTWMDVLKGTFLERAQQQSVDKNQSNISQIFTNIQTTTMTKETLADALAILMTRGLDATLSKAMDSAEMVDEDSTETNPLEKKMPSSRKRKMVKSKMYMKKADEDMDDEDYDDGDDDFEDEDHYDEDEDVMKKSRKMKARSSDPNLVKAIRIIADRLISLEDGLSMVLDNTVIGNTAINVLTDEDTSPLTKGLGMSPDIESRLTTLSNQVQKLTDTLGALTTGRKSVGAAPLLTKGVDQQRPSGIVKSVTADKTELSNILMAKFTASTDSNIKKAISDLIPTLEMGVASANNPTLRQFLPEYTLVQ